MEAVDQTAPIGKEDALLPKVVGETKECDDAGPKTTALSTCGTGDGEAVLKVLERADGELDDGKKQEAVVATDAKQLDSESAAAEVESGDDLLDKIERVVNDDGASNGKASVDDCAIAESSEMEFLKRLEDAEHETDEAKKSEEDGGAAEAVEECVTSSDEKEKAAAGNASAAEECDETDRALSDNIVDSTSQELGAKISEKVVAPPEEKEAQSSEEVTEIISSEDDENAEQTVQAKNGAKSEAVVEISSDEGSDEIALVEKSNSDSEVQLVGEEVADKEAQSSTVDEEAAKKAIAEADTEPMSVDMSPANDDDTMEIDEEEKMDVDMGENISENDEEMPAVIEADSDTKNAEETVKVAEAVAIESAEAVAEIVEEKAADRPEPETETETIKETESADETAVEVNEAEAIVATDEKKASSEIPEQVSVSSTDADDEINSQKATTPKKTEPHGSAATPSASSADPVQRESLSVEVKKGQIEIPDQVSVSSTEENITQEDSTPQPATPSESADAEPLKIESLLVEVKKGEIEISEQPSVSSSEAEENNSPKKTETQAATPSESNAEPVKIESSNPPTLSQSSSVSAQEVNKPSSTPVSTTKQFDDSNASIEIIEPTANNGKNQQEEVEKPERNVKLTNETGAKSSLGSGVVRVENKLLANTMKHGGSIASLDGSPVSAASGANVFNSTPIQKQFEISSENVSKISEANDEANRTEEAAHLSKTEEESTEIGTTTTSDSSNQTDSVTKYLNVIKQYNGIAATEEKAVPSKPIQKVSQQSHFDIMPADLLSSQVDLDSKKSQYEINVWYEERDIRFLSIEKLETNKKSMHTTLETTSGGDTSEKLSSNGSVSSLQPFTLPPFRATEMSLSGSSTGSQKALDLKPNLPTAKRNKHTVTGIVELCTFMIDQFTKIKHEIEPPKTTEPTTPKLKGRGSDSIKRISSKGKSVSPQVLSSSSAEVDETPTKKIDKRTLKRTLNKSSLSDDDDESKPKAAKQSKTTTQPKTPSKNSDMTDLSVIGYCVLAKWVDKKYYAGKVTDAKAGNKFVILFEDGASKVLPKESVVFGEDDILPLQDQSVYALIDDDYELGLVKSIEKTDEQKVIYTVDIDGKDVKISASDIYITDQQAKAIQSLKAGHPLTPTTSATLSSTTKGGAASSDTPIEKSSPGGTNTTTSASRSTRNKRQATSPITPEAGFSGGVTKRGRRQKRPILQQTRISESSDISDSPEMNHPPQAPSSPESALEAIEGVQPELQKTPKESEISRMIIISDYMKKEPSRDISELLGPLPISKTLFKNKYFLLTCTVGQELPPIGSNSMNNSNEIALTNKNAIFSSVPFIKQQLQKQIQEGGGTVYNHFEDVPKTKYKQCKLISSRPCTTAKYIQCLAADMQPISHEWVIESCTKNILADFKKYLLPSGWSITNETYINWSLRKSNEYRQSNKPFLKEIVLIASEHDDFVTFWSRVCKLAGATLRYVKKLSDVTPTTTGYLVTEQDFPQVIKSKAEHYGIPIVSTLWIVQSLILGKVCDPLSHGKFTQIYQDDDL